jgi:hypothetical protein
METQLEIAICAKGFLAMSTDRDGLLIHLAAESMMDQYGPYAARISHERAEAADAIGDLLSADAWRDIAQAIELLQTSYYKIETRRSTQRPGEREPVLRVVP